MSQPPPGWLDRRNQAIREYCEAGLVPVPLKGKRPYQKGWQKQTPQPYEEVIQRFGDSDNVGLLMGIPYGKSSGGYLRGVDYDDPALHNEHCDIEPFPAWLDTGVVVRTGSGKWHHYLLVNSPDKYVFSGKEMDHGGEVQGTGTQLVAPPSIHPDTGVEYEFAFDPDWENLSFVLDTTLKKNLIPYKDQIPEAAAPLLTPPPTEPVRGIASKYSAADASLPVALSYDDAATYDYNSIDWVSLFKDRFVVYQAKAGGSYIVQCPNAGHHSSDTDGTTSTMLLPSTTTPGRVRFNCKHGGCAHLNDQDALIEFIGGASALEGYAQKFRVADPDLGNRFTYAENTKYGHEVTYYEPPDPKRVFTFETHAISSGGLLPMPDPLIPPGMLGELVKWVIDTSPHPIPILSLAACLAYASALLGHAYTGLGGAKPQLYCVGIAPTGLGKEHIRSALKALSGLAGPQVGLRWVDGKMTSLRAMERKLNERDGRMVWMLDEFGKAMVPVLENGKGGSSFNYMSSLQDLLLQLDGMTNTIYCGQNYADSGKNETINIKWPILSMYGTTAPDSYVDQLDHRLVHDGFLNRILHFRTREAPPIHKSLDFIPSFTSPPQPLVDLVKDWELRSIEDDHGKGPDIVAAGEPSGRIEPRLVTADDDAKKIFYDFETEVHEWKQELNQRIKGGQDILARTTWKVRKIALILAAADDQRVVGARYMNYAVDLVRYCESEMVSMIPDIEGNQRSKVRHQELDSILRFVEGAGPIGVTNTEITRKFRNQMDKRRREELVTTLRESNEIVQVVINQDGQGRPVSRLVAIQFYTPPTEESETSN